jgi:hypothetical protein
VTDRPLPEEYGTHPPRHVLYWYISSGRPASNSHEKATAAPNPNPAHPANEYSYDSYDAEVPGAADALLRLDVSVAAAEDAPAETPPPMEASSSGSAAVGGGRKEEGLRLAIVLVS